MSDSALARYQEFYCIAEAVPVSVIPVTAEQVPDSFEVFESEVPEVFRLANDIRAVDQNSAQALRGLGDIAKVIQDVLHQQNTKLNLLLGYVLSREDDSDHRFQTLEYGGGGFKIEAPANSFKEGDLAQVKLFLRDIAAAVYAYAEVAEVTASGEQQQVTLAFNLIREDDQEIIVRASLHAQSRLLKKRAEDRKG
ncbi:MULTISPECIES: PilZ domain-containing protein [Gammaproteobacteria]|uniref:PilZ domain-containing protein n=1 Tax=Gammaproteobacteria TaxID=1236 RepID=UPI000DCFDB82|nr:MULTISPECIES: PilZ domain-containing protein [Gammaproteobacteria]RTE86939.1 PilZ domain-containing protein [Aliidiomarina sp. B3213]TCZ93271.1 PilZ domain-containing protein [Lysobacter sp. N42]